MGIFAQGLKPEEHKRFQELEDLYGEQADLENVEAFTLGFKLGASLMIDIFQEVPEPAKDIVL